MHRSSFAGAAHKSWYALALGMLATMVACGSDPLGNPTPGITAINPAGLVAGSSQFTIDVTGSDFVIGSGVQWNGSARPTTFQSRTHVTAEISASDIASVGVAQVTVVNPAPGGGVSNAAPFVVQVRPNPQPQLTALTPNHVTAGAGELLVGLDGSNFVSTSTVSVAGSPVAATFVSPTQLEIRLAASLLATARTLPIVVSSPAPGGGSSSALFLAVENPLPVISALGSSTVLAGQGSATVQVEGAGFVAGSVVRFNGAPRSTSFTSATRLSATLESGDLRDAGSYTITVVNPAPGGGTSNEVSIGVAHGVPTITTLPSRSATAGRVVSIAIDGSGFTSASVVTWNGQDRSTTYGGWNRLSFALTAADVASPGVAQVAVRNPAPGGGTSAPVSVTVRAAPTATVAGLTTIAGGPSDLLYDPRTGRLYAGMQSGAYAGQIVVIDPASGQITASVAVGTGLGKMALSDDGRYLYIVVGRYSLAQIRRVQLSPLEAQLQFTPPAVMDLQVVPGAPGSVAVANGYVTIFDDGLKRPRTAPTYPDVQQLAFGDAGALYGYNSASSGFDVTVMSVMSDGVVAVKGKRALLSGFFSASIMYAAGRLYGTGDAYGTAQVADPELLVTNGSFGTYGSALLPDPELGRFFLVRNGVLHTYDLNDRQELGATMIVADMGQSSCGRGQGIRWSGDGLAFCDDGRIYLFHSGLAAP